MLETYSEAELMVGSPEEISSRILSEIEEVRMRSVCVCVCVCEREREIDRDRERERERDRERERRREVGESGQDKE
jgi:F0F1-type ATP synthase epsilon subunit